MQKVRKFFGVSDGDLHDSGKYAILVRGMMVMGGGRERGERGESGASNQSIVLLKLL